MARHVEDLCAMMPILLGPDGEDRTVVPMPYTSPEKIDTRDLRIAWFADNGIASPDDETRAVVEAAASALCATEHRPPAIAQSYDLEMKILGADGGDGLREFCKSIGSTQTHPLLDGWLAKLEQHRTSVAGLAEYWAEWDAFRASMLVFLKDYDAILSPVAAHPALPHGTSIEENRFRGFSYTMTYNMTGWPAAVVRAVDRDATVARNLGNALLQVIERHIHAAVDMVTLPLARISHVEQERRIGARELFGDHRRAHALGGPHQIGPRGQRFHASREITLHMIESDAAQPHGCFLFTSGLGDDHDGLRSIEHGAGPGRILTAEPDVDAAREVSFGVFGGVAHVENLSACVAHLKNFGEIDRT
jgi:hypothetical protein